MITTNSTTNLLDQLLDSITPVEQHRTDTRMQIAARLADALQEKNISQTQLAQMLGKHHSMITKWLSGTNNFTIDTLSDIETALGINLMHVTESQTTVIEFHFAVRQEFKNENVPSSYNVPVRPNYLSDSDPVSDVQISMKPINKRSLAA